MSLVITTPLTINPDQKRALDWLRGTLSGQAYAQGTRLPPVRVLAREAAVSVKAMSAALRQLASEGILTIRQRVGIHVGQPLQTDNFQAPQHKWERIYSRLKQDILTGAFLHQATLPFLKKLCIRYQANYQTFRKAVRRLIHENLISEQNGCLKVNRFPRQAFGGTILFCCSIRKNPYQVSFFSNRLRNAFNELQVECGLASVNWRFHGISNATTSPKGLLLLPGLFARHNIIGSIVWTQGIESAAPGIYNALAAFKKPIAIIDELGILSLPSVTPPPAKVFVISAYGAGQAVGNFLLTAGHKRVAYISADHGERWSLERCHGLNDAWKSSGIMDGVRAHIMTAAEIPEISADQNTTAANLALMRLLRRIQAIAQKGKKGISEKTMIDFLGYEAAEQIGSWRKYEYYKQAVINCTEQALAYRDTTALVCCNDFTAIIALDYLRSRRVSVPRDMTVIGFDNSPEGAEFMITSYDFSIRTMLARALSFVLYPTQIDLGRGPIYEHEGLIIVRETSGAPRRETR